MWPSGAFGASGVPGLTSTKKFPSRNVRGRIANVASVCSGSPWSSIVIVTWAAEQLARPGWSWAQPGTLPMPVTLPTLTPAIRTSDPGRSPPALANVAWTVNGLANGLANFVNARYVNTTITTIPITPAANALRPRRRRARVIGRSQSSGAGGRSAGCG